MFSLLSLIFRYLFILIIYLFIFAVIRLIYLDIKGMMTLKKTHAYLKLLILKEQLPFDAKEAYIIDKTTTIGRKKGNGIVILDPFISGKHARISIRDSRFYIKDLNSSNGTYVNGSIITEEIELHDNDRIKMGQLEFLFISK